MPLLFDGSAYEIQKLFDEYDKKFVKEVDNE